MIGAGFKGIIPTFLDSIDARTLSGVAVKGLDSASLIAVETTESVEWHVSMVLGGIGKSGGSSFCATRFGRSVFFIT